MNRTTRKGDYFGTPTWEALYLSGLIPVELGIDADHYAWFRDQAVAFGLNPEEHVEKVEPLTYKSMNCKISEDLYLLLKAQSDS